jgi:hypothetical protein
MVPCLNSGANVNKNFFLQKTQTNFLEIIHNIKKPVITRL